MSGYVNRLIRAKRRDPSDDLLTHLIMARDDGNKLSERELVDLGATLVVVGYETIANQLSVSTLTLLQNPDAARPVREGSPAEVAAAVEELLRLDATFDVAHPRIAVTDVVLGGQLVRAGDPVQVSLAHASRDRAVFDTPDTFDPTRRNAAHLAFGYGFHHCLGAQLARSELQTALAMLFRRLPHLTLAVPAADVEWRPGAITRGPSALPVRW
jgi:nocardicin N-oxygenase